MMLMLITSMILFVSPEQVTHSCIAPVSTSTKDNQRARLDSYAYVHKMASLNPWLLVHARDDFGWFCLVVVLCMCPALGAKRSDLLLLLQLNFAIVDHAITIHSTTSLRHNERFWYSRYPVLPFSKLN